MAEEDKVETTTDQVTSQETSHDTSQEKPRQENNKEVDEIQEKPMAVLDDAQVLGNKELLHDAFEGENREHDESAWESAKKNPMACFWAFIFCFTIVMEAFDMFLNTNFVALEAFQRRFGVELPDGGHSILTKWQMALQCGGQVGAFVGVFLAGPITDRVGYRWGTIIGLVLMNATIFVSFFAESIEVLVVGQVLEGIPWGFFIANSPAYASEVVPLALRGVITGTLQMSWSVGQIIVAAATKGYNTRLDHWAWKAPLALQWLWPTPLLVLIFFSPESPWWLIRHGKKEQALKSIKRLRGGKAEGSATEQLAMIERVIEIEAKEIGSPTLLDLWKGTDLRRTLIICLTYASQNLAGNLIANQATYFFEQAGMTPAFSFDLNVINTCLQLVANLCALPLTAYLGRRTIYLWGTGANVAFLLVMGIIASVPKSNSTNYGVACMGVVVSFFFAFTQGPISYTIIAETSSIRLRALSTAVGRASYYLVEIPMICLASAMLNTTGWDLGGKCGYFWACTAIVCWVTAYFGLPELKNRSYREADILFNRHVSARKFKTTVIAVDENE